MDSAINAAQPNILIKIAPNRSTSSPYVSTALRKGILLVSAPRMRRDCIGRVAHVLAVGPYGIY